MTDRYYAAAFGTTSPGQVVEGAAATPASPFEFRLTYDATGMTKHDAVKGLRAIQYFITRDTWPPV